MSPGAAPGWRITLSLSAVALAVRGAFVHWAAFRFPVTGDGFFYDTFARRLASGEGYTWAWPDGAVTAAAHYPAGYPGILALFYALFGSAVGVAMYVNVALGTVAVAASHRCALGFLSPSRAMVAALAVALHPALVLYTPAVMTEGAALSLLLLAAAVGLGEGRANWRAIGAGVLMGAATLVRPQCVLLAPLLAACMLLGRPVARAPIARAAAVVGLCVLTCLPWTIRNCSQMHRCALVSVNGGWNLAIGEASATGSWEPIVVPEACKTVWDEAEKDACFEREAKRAIAAHPLAWMAKAPKKLATTFDYFGAGPWYLHASNPSAFPDAAKEAWGALETVASRALLACALAAFALTRGAARVPRAVAALGGAFAISPAGWVAYLLLAVVIAIDRKRSRFEAFAALLIASTALTHAVFFGAGRYGLVVAPFVAILALRPPARGANVSASMFDRRSPADALTR